MLENYSRAVLASALSRTQDLTAYLIVPFAAIRQYGSPEALVVATRRAAAAPAPATPPGVRS